MKLRYIVALGAVLPLLALSGCNRHKPELNSLPPTLVGTLVVMPKGRETKALYNSVLKLGDAYGLIAYGDGASDNVNWTTQIFCRTNGTAIAHTAGNGELILFQVYSYGFKRAEDYEHYKEDLLLLMKKFGTITRQEERKPLNKEDLIQRERYVNLDLTSQCEGKLGERDTHQGRNP